LPQSMYWTGGDTYLVTSLGIMGILSGLLESGQSAAPG
jgi:hypothetical protein